MKKACAIWLLAVAWFSARAQPPFQLTGRIIDSTGSALSHATVQFIAPWDTLSTVTTDNGNFIFRRLKTRTFRLTVTMKGYLSSSRSYSIEEGKTVLQLAPFILQTDYIDLDPVTVTRLRPITMNGDTVSYHTAAFPVRDGSDVEDILKRLPGLEVDMDGNIIVQGKRVEKVLVNGKEFFGGDILVAIKNLPADIVDKLQVIDDYGDKARLTGVLSGNATKVLNIVLKSDKHNGQFGKMQATAGGESKYASDAFLNAFEGDRQISARAGLSNNSPAGSDFIQSGSFNYANQWNPKWGGALNLASAGQSPRTNSSVIQNSYYPGEQVRLSQDNQNTSHIGHTDLTSRLTYKPSSYSTLRISASIGLPKTSTQVSGQTTTLQEDSNYNKVSNGTSLTSYQSTSQTYSSNLYYEKLSRHSRERFSVESGFSFSNSHSINNEKSSAIINAGGDSTNSFLHYLISDNTHGWNGHVNTTYYLPMGPSSFVEFGYRGQSAVSRALSITREQDSTGGPSVVVDSLTQNIGLHSVSQDLYTGYTDKLGPIDLTASLAGQYGEISSAADVKGNIISFRNFSFVPLFQANWKIDQGRRVHLNFGGHPTLPSPQQLSPFTDLSNLQYPVTGNPALKSSYTNNLSLNFEQSSLRPTQSYDFGVGVAYSFTQHTIIENLTVPKDTGQVIQNITYRNAGVSSDLALDYHFSLPAIIRKRLRVNMTGIIDRVDNITMSNGLQYVDQTWAWTQSMHLQLMIPDLIESDLSANYSLNHNSYPKSGNPPTTFKSANIALTSRFYILHNWIVNYQFSQYYTSNGVRLQPATTNMTASLQREFLLHRKATITLSGYNLLAESSAVQQTVSPASFIQTKSVLTGRYILITFSLKLQRFHQ